MAKTTKALVPILLSLLLLAIGCAKKPPMLTSISPASGPSGGGTPISITGENFKEGATVTIAGKEIKGLSINAEGTKVTGTTPGGPPGAQPLVARNLKAKEPSTALTFTYEALKVVSTVPADGSELPWDPRTMEVSAKLSQPIEAGSASISISGVTGEASYDASTQMVSFMADKPLRTAQSYQVTVSGAKDKAGNTMSDYAFGFSIEEAEKLNWYTVKEGDTLPIIAARPDVYEDEAKWQDILAYNQDQEWNSEDKQQGSDNVIDYKNLTPGMDLYIPR